MLGLNPWLLGLLVMFLIFSQLLKIRSETNFLGRCVAKMFELCKSKNNCNTVRLSYVHSKELKNNTALIINVVSWRFYLLIIQVVNFSNSITGTVIEFEKFGWFLTSKNDFESTKLAFLSADFQVLARDMKATSGARL